MIDRLRTWARNGHVPVALADDCKDAADEIERLRKIETALREIAKNSHDEQAVQVANHALSGTR